VLHRAAMARRVSSEGSAAAKLSAKPAGPFDPSAVPPSPDYTRQACWAARPDAARAEADCFYVHATSHFGTAWNAAWDDDAAAAQVRELHVGMHATAFQDACDVYAPHYRQISYAAFGTRTPEEARPAADLAYSDVAAAFAEFLKRNAEARRPYFIAAHSQGAMHATRLVQELDGTAGAERCVAAYLVGMSIPLSVLDGLRTFRPCEGPQHAGGALISWQLKTADAAVDDDSKNYLNVATGGPGCPTPNGGWINGTGPTLQVSPLVWRAHHLGPEPPAATEEHLGVALPVYEPGFTPLAIFDGSFRSSLQRIMRSKRKLSATATAYQVVVGGLGDKVAQYDLGQGVGDLHPLDFSCFYYNLQRDVARRLAAYYACRRDGPRAAL